MPAKFSLLKAKESQARDLPFQQVMESLMKETSQTIAFDAMYLFNAEGLPLAQHVISQELLSAISAVEISVMIYKMRKFVKKMSGLDIIRELYMEDEVGRKLVFRFLTVFRQDAILLMVIPVQKRYRGGLNRLTKNIMSIADFSLPG